mgnify:CR=1 FL=1
MITCGVKLISESFNFKRDDKDSTCCRLPKQVGRLALVKLRLAETLQGTQVHRRHLGVGVVGYQHHCRGVVVCNQFFNQFFSGAVQEYLSQEYSRPNVQSGGCSAPRRVPDSTEIDSGQMLSRHPRIQRSRRSADTR